ncbi:hypothetical protein F5Y04DRAFT_281492 [Hypomontagnella monticulosa]|nr:hypothetical protein F5Y04DRAFT_281492 [Hypomontagnella monticulosa]
MNMANKAKNIASHLSIKHNEGPAYVKKHTISPRKRARRSKEFSSFLWSLKTAALRPSGAYDRVVYGDQKTTSFIRRIKQSELEAGDARERKKWLLPVPNLFHIELNYIEILFQVSWDTGNNGRNSATSWS